jgi:hypothetical protein
MTASQLQELPGNSALALPAVIWLGHADDFDDAVAYWNLRTLVPLSFERAPILMTNTDSLKAVELVSAISDAARRRIVQTEPDVIMVCQPDAFAGATRTSPTGRAAFTGGLSGEPRRLAS